MTEQRERGRTVYFLGAGASKSIYPQLPLASELTLAHLADLGSYHHEARYHDACETLEKLLGKMPEGENLRVKPLELAFETMRRAGAEHEGVTSFCLLKKLYIPMSVPEGSWVLHDFLRFVRQNRDTIITPNYDTLVEATLLSMETGEYRPNCFDAMDRDALHWVDYGLSRVKTAEFEFGGPWPTAPERSILLLKLHGSSSWIRCRKCNRPLFEKVWQRAVDVVAGNLAYRPCECGANSWRLVIVPPTVQKEYKDEAINEIWEKAADVLSQAEKIVFAGFSLNETDQGIQDLLRRAYSAGNTRRVLVVDANPAAVKQRYLSVYGDKVRFATEGDWKRYLENLLATPSLRTAQAASTVS